MATVIDRRGMQHGGVAKEKRIEIENIFIITGAGQTYLHLDARALLSEVYPGQIRMSWG